MRSFHNPIFYLFSGAQTQEVSAVFVGILHVRVFLIIHPKEFEFYKELFGFGMIPIKGFGCSSFESSIYFNCVSN